MCWYPDEFKIGEVVGSLSVSYGEVIEFQLPLDVIGNPESIVINVIVKTDVLENAGMIELVKVEI